MLPEERFRRKETKACLIIWVSVVLYAIYQFTIVSQKYFHQYHDHYEDFTMGWSFLDLPKKDKADFEWETIWIFLNNIYPVMVFYLIVSEGCRSLSMSIKLQQCFRISFSLLYLTYSMGYKIALTATLQPVLFSIAAVYQKKTLIWICNIACLALITIYKQLNANKEFLQDLGINHFEAYLNILLVCWMNLKCTSFNLNNVLTSKHSLLDYFSYCFYFPTIFTGPFIGYNDFKKIHVVKSFESLDIRLRKLGLNILRCIFWIVFVDFWLHFVYVNAASFQLEFIKNLDLCSLCGYGYLMGQFFHLKYVILYGLSTSLASFENVSVPRLPRCIGRIHLYSDMWKYFDPGLYNFLKMCIFVPTQKLGANKFVSSFLCFAFVYVWHGTEQYILVWALLNFLGVCIESTVLVVYNKKWTWVKCIRKIKDTNLRRLKCVLAAPLLAMSAMSNFYFFAGKEVGDVFVGKTLTEPYFNQALVFAVLYCCCQVSTELRDVEAHRM